MRKRHVLTRVFPWFDPLSKLHSGIWGVDHSDNAIRRLLHLFPETHFEDQSDILFYSAGLRRHGAIDVTGSNHCLRAD
jgi:hypothetical protein